MSEITTIGLIDDEEDFLYEINSILEENVKYKSNLKIFTTTCINDAISWVKSNKINVLVADLRMPDMNGIRLLQTVSSINSDISLVLLTAFVLNEDEKELCRSIKIKILYKEDGFENIISNLFLFSQEHKFREIQKRKIHEKGNVFQEDKRFSKRTPWKKGEIHILIASPSDVFLSADFFFARLERKFRVENYEALCMYRLVVHSWHELASESGYTQDLIMKHLLEKVDIVVAIFKHKLGTPTIDIDTKKVRYQSGTAEELLYAIRNPIESNQPLGMAYFHSKAPNPSFDSFDFQEKLNDWNKLKEFKDDIIDKILYKPYNDENELLDLLCKDLSINIHNYFKKIE